MTIRIHLPQLNYTRLNYGQSPTNRIAYGSIIFSTSLNNFQNQGTDPPPLPQYPYGENGIWLPILPPGPFGNLDGGGLFGGAPANPPPLPQRPPVPEDTMGFITRIYDFDPMLVKDPADIGLNAFKPKNMILEFLEADPNVCTKSDPINSVIEGVTYKEYKDWVKQVWFPSIKANLEIFPQFQNDINNNKIVQFMLVNQLHPQFAYFTKDSFLLTDLKYTYCQYDPTDSMKLVNCGLCEPHEATYMQTYGAYPVGSLQKYEYTFYPNVLFKDQNIPLCDKCLQWKVRCDYKNEDSDIPGFFLPCTDVEPQVFPVQEIVDQEEIDDGTTLYFKKREDAVEYVEKLMNPLIPPKIYYSERCFECLKINKHCYDQNIENDPEYYDDYRFYNTMEECDNDTQWIVTCEWKDGEQLLEVVEIKNKDIKGIILDGLDGKCISSTGGFMGGRVFWTEEQALTYKNDPNNLRYYPKNDECKEVHNLCTCHVDKPDYPQLTFATQEECEEWIAPDNSNWDSMLNINKQSSFVFDPKTGQWQKI